MTFITILTPLVQSFVCRGCDMRQDINFFSTYLSKKEQTKNQNRYGYFLGATTLLIILGAFIIQSVQEFRLSSKINELNEALNSKEIQEQIVESDRVYEMLEVLDQYDQELNILVDNIMSRDLITTQLLNQISSTIPSDVTFSGLSINDTTITMQASSQSRTAIAEVQHNLKQLSFIKDVYIGSISAEAPYSFSLSCTINGGAQ